MSSTYYKFYINLDLYAHLLDEDGSINIGRRPLQALKLLIPRLEITILVFWEKSFKSKEADHSKCLASPLLAS